MTKARSGRWPPTGIDYRRLARGLKERGFRRARQTGSHETWRHPDGRTITVNGKGRASSVDDRVTNSVRAVVNT